jgi:hypothetical protein
MLAMLLIIGTIGVASDEAAPPRVGQIIVIGNETTPIGDILELVPVYPGQIAPTKEELRKIERALVERFRDRVNSKRLRIELLDPRSPYQDVVIHFPEKPTRKK